MKRTFELDQTAFDALDDAGKADYVPAPNRPGSFHLDLDLPTGIRGVLDKERSNYATVNRELAQLRAAHKDLPPADVLTALQGKDPAAVVAHLGTLQTPLQIAEAELARVRAETGRVACEAALTTALTAAGGAAEALMPYLKGLGLEYKAGGKLKLDDDEYPDAAALAVALREKLPGLYSGSGNSGGSGSGTGRPPANGGGKPPAAKAPTSRAKMSLSEKTAFIKANGTDKFMQLPK